MQNYPNINAEEILNSFELKTKSSIRNELSAIYADPGKRNALKNALENDHAAYALLTMCCDDVEKIDHKRLAAAIDHLKENKMDESVIKTLEITLAYLKYHTSQISPSIFTGVLINAINAEEPALILLPKAKLGDIILNGQKLDFSYANFRGAMLSSVNFSGCNFEHADFTGCSTNGTDFTNCTLAYTDFSKCNLAKMKLGSPTSVTETTIILDNEYLLDAAKLNKFLDICIAQKIPPTFALNAVKRNLQYLGHQPKTYDYDAKLELWKCLAKHKLFTAKANRLLQADEFCARNIKKEITNVEENIRARDDKKRYPGQRSFE